MSNLLTLNFWFNLRPEPLTSLFQNSILIFAILLVAGVIIFKKVLIKPKTKSIYDKIWLRLGTFSLANAILGFIFWFFSYEMTPILSAKFLLGAWAIFMLVWLVLIFKQAKKIPQRKECIKKQQEYNKYLPKK